MRKRILGFILAVSTLLVLTPNTVMAARMDEMPAAVRETADSSSEMQGIGTETAPYRIKNAEQLRAFADMVNGVNGTPDTGLCAVLACDIDLSGLCSADIGSWTPIGTSANPYTGIFDGGSFAITGLYYHKSSSSYAGLFGNNAGTIKNLGVAGADIAAGSYTGAVCGYNSGIITGCYNTASVNGSDYTGGVCGYNNVGGTVSICYNLGAVSGRKYVGGICGYNKNTTVDCYNMGSVYGKRTSIGGICGYNRELVSNCFNTGAVNNGGRKYIGSVCGYNHSQSTFLNCYYLITGEEKGNYGVAMTQEQFASGEVCWLLNDGKSKNVVWYQTCGAGFPAFGGKVVYQVRRPKTGGSADEMIVAYINETEKKQAVNASDNTSDENTHGHVYQEPEWTWQEYKAAKAVFTCQDCGEKLSLEASISDKTTKATCGKEGKTVYTASVVRDGATYTDMKTVKLEKPEHQQLVLRVVKDATCTESGIKRECFTCPVCEKYFEDQEGTKELPKKDVEIPAGHLYTEPEWVWNIENNPPVATAVFNCSRGCGKAVEKKGRVTADKIANCTTTEAVVYTAVVDFNGETYSDNKPVSVQQIPHSYGEPEWDWAKDFSVATATFTCKVCNHPEAKIATLTTDTTPSTCKKAGNNKHTAVVEFGDKKYSDVQNELLPLGSHDFGEPVWTWAKDNKSATATFTCGSCKKNVPQPTDNVTEKRPEGSTCGAPGEITYTATVTFEGNPYTGIKTEKIVIDHTLKHFPKVSAKCETGGNEEYWECEVCHKYFSDKAGEEEISGIPVISATGHALNHVEGDIYVCSACNNRFVVKVESNGTPTMYSVDEDTVIPQDETANSEETQGAPQSEDEHAGETDQSGPEEQNGENGQSGPESQNGETAQNEPESQDEQTTQSEQNVEGGKNEDEICDVDFDVPENAARYGLIYPEGVETDFVPANTWEESAINLRVTTAGKTVTQTDREQQQGYPLWVSVAVLFALASVVLILLCKRKAIDDQR